MRRLGFCEQWVQLIMTCVTTVTYRIKVNGELSESFRPERGLRQGDPLSPYLFLLCTEGFSALLHKAEEDGLSLELESAGQLLVFLTFSLPMTA